MSNPRIDPLRRQVMDRRRFLSLSALAVAGAVTGCASTPAPSPTAAPTKAAAAGASAATAVPKPVAPNTGPNMRFGIQYAPGTPEVKASQMFADEVANASGGKLKIDIYPNLQLGQMREMLEATSLGIQDFFASNQTWAAVLSPKWDIISVPFLVKSYDKLFEALDGEFGKTLDADIQKQGLKVIGWWRIGARQLINAVRPVNTPDDLKGLKIRVQPTPLWVNVFKAFGANPVAMDFGEVYSSIQQHTLDGFDNNLTNIYTLKFYEVCKYLTLSNHTIEPYAMYVNKKLFDGWSPDQQKIVLDAAKKASDYQRKESVNLETGYLSELKSKMQVNELSDANFKLFRDAMAPVYDQVAKDMGQDWLDMAKKYLS